MKFRAHKVNLRGVAMAAMLAFTAVPAVAADSDFHAGTVIPAYGKVATIQSDMPLPADAVWKVSFDASEGNRGKINGTLDSAARFLNMMAEAGVPRDHVKLAIVIHGKAGFDVSNAARYARYYGDAENPNPALVKALLDAGVQLWVCGQSAAANDIAKADLQPGVKMALSAMTAHAELQRQGYSIMPF